MKLSKLNIKKINFNDIDINYSSQDILMKLGELYQFESGIYGYGNIWTKLERNIEKIIIEELDKQIVFKLNFLNCNQEAFGTNQIDGINILKKMILCFILKIILENMVWLQLQKNAQQYLDQIDYYHTSNYQQHIIKLERSLEKK